MHRMLNIINTTKGAVQIYAPSYAAPDQPDRFMGAFEVALDDLKFKIECRAATIPELLDKMVFQWDRIVAPFPHLAPAIEYSAILDDSIPGEMPF